MRSHPLPPPLRGAETGTFTRRSIIDRLPEIGRRLLAENDFPEPVAAALQALISEIPDGRIRPIPDADIPDIADWNRWTAVYAADTWLTVPWFFAETYFYRRIIGHTGWFRNGRDPFAIQKRLGLSQNRDPIRQLAHSLDNTDFAGLLAVSLWGNQADLSLWPANGDEQPNHAHAADQEAHLLVDDRAQLLAFLAEQPRHRLDVLLDNAGFEFVADLALADAWLAQAETAVVHLHAKLHPTFVSDVIAADWELTLAFLREIQDKGVSRLGERLAAARANGRLQLHTHPFWTSPLPAWEMPGDLRRELAQAQLVVSKGDANYRRLLGDRHWPFTTPFAAITSYFPAPLLALRTSKSEAAAGLSSAQLTHLAKKDPDWQINGRWGLIQFSQPAPTVAGGKA